MKPFIFALGIGIGMLVTGTLSLGRPAPSTGVAAPPQPERTAQPARAEANLAQPRMGAVMLEVGRRFELIGRAIAARKLDLAAYEAEELGEVFEIDFARAIPPDDNDAINSGAVNLGGLGDAFASSSLPALRTALRSGDARAIARTYGEAAQVCSGCHSAIHLGFLAVSAEPGRAVPIL